MFLKLLLEELNRRNINYAILRGYDNIPESMSGGDLDLWLPKKEYATVLNIVSDCLKKTDGQIVSFLNNLIAPKITVLGMKCGLQIDFCLEPTNYKCARYLSNNYIQENTIEFNGYKVLSKEADSLLAFLKEILNNGCCKKQKYIESVKEYVKDHSNEFVKKQLDMFSPRTQDFFITTIKDNDIEDIPLLSKMMRRDLRSFDQKISYVKNQLLKLNRFFTPTGYVIVVEGTDGSGKSFVIETLTPWLDQAFHNGVIYNHLRPSWLPDLAVVLGKRKKTAPGEDVKVVSNPHSGKQSGFAMSLVRWAWYMLDYTLGYMKKIWMPVHSKSKVFIFDRYYYEFYLDQKRSHVKLPNWVVKIGELFLPKPDLILCLGGDPEKIYTRKPETSLDEVSRQTMVLKDFCNKRKNAVWIDTTVKPEESIDAAMKAIVAVMGRRFKLENIR